MTGHFEIWLLIFNTLDFSKCQKRIFDTPEFIKCYRVFFFTGPPQIRLCSRPSGKSERKKLEYLNIA